MAGTRQPDAADLNATSAISVTDAERLGLKNAKAALEVMEDGRKVDEISITRAPVTIGRMSSNDVVLSDGNVSRRHAEIRQNGTDWMLVDLGSTNGSLVNGKVAKEHKLSDGDRLTLGESELVFRIKGN
jgi:pSer/pThr/pTyr-binding forkhead associated (FHA) protein